MRAPASTSTVILIIGIFGFCFVLYRNLKVDDSGKSIKGQSEIGSLKGNSETFDQDFDLSARLNEAESNWKRGVTRRHEALKHVKLVDGLDFPKYQMLWDFFYPQFDCPYTKERIGRVGDGGKWICGFSKLAKKKNCLVYSFGVSGDTSFEDELLDRTENCKVVMFDPTIGTENPPIIKRYPTRAEFRPIGLSSAVSDTMGTLKSILTADNVEKVDILKIDIESAEWATLENILVDYPHVLPFNQLNVEFHLYKTSDHWLGELTKIWEKLEGAGLRAFFTEPNLLNVNSNRFIYWEASFLNTKSTAYKVG